MSKKTGKRKIGAWWKKEWTEAIKERKKELKEKFEARKWKK